MLPLIAAAVTGGFIGNKVYNLGYPLLAKFEKNKQLKPVKPFQKNDLPGIACSDTEEKWPSKLFNGISRTSAPTLQLLRESISEEQPIILATEEIPLDNRFGNKTLISEHEFVRTASVTFSMARDHLATSRLTGGFWTIFEGLAQEEIKKTLNIELDAHITRRVKVVFSTAPGHLVRYRVIWRQDARRGLFVVNVEGKMYRVPYLVVFGLSQAIESIAGESLERKNLNAESPMAISNSGNRA
ncbi:hypothetical protein CCP3SC5AM1_1460005 [Gammaproteobacteria bacterium]